MMRKVELDKEVLKETQSILADLNSGDEIRIRQIYTSFFPSIKNLVMSNHGSLEDAEDIYQDSLLIIFQKLRSSELQIHCAFSTYLYSVARHLWLQRLRSKRVQSRNEEMLNEPDLHWTKDAFAEEMKLKLFREHYRKLKPDCRKVIRMMIERKSLEDIAQKMGFRNSNYAKTKKFNCKEILRRRILNDPRYKSLFE